MRPRNVWQVLSTGLLIAGTVEAGAQVAGSVGQLAAVQGQQAVERATQQRFQNGESAPELYPGEAGDIGPQSILEIKEHRSYFQALADAQFFYTDNALLEKNNTKEAGILVGTVQLALAPTPYKLFDGLSSPRLGYRHQWYNFFELDSQSPNLDTGDFNASTFFVDEHWSKGDWTFGAGFDYTRLLSTSSYTQFYTEYVPRWEVQRIFPINEKQAFSAAYVGYYHFTDTAAATLPENSAADRLDNGIELAYSYVPMDHVVLQPFYRFKYTRFTKEVSRDDYLNSLGLNLYYFFNEKFNARIFATYDAKSSSIDAAEYGAFSAGVGVNFTLRF